MLHPSRSSFAIRIPLKALCFGPKLSRGHALDKAHQPPQPCSQWFTAVFTDVLPTLEGDYWIIHASLSLTSL